MDDFARSFAAALFEAAPELQQYARADHGLLLIDLSPGPARSDCEFWVSTDDEEITVGFGMYHQHFDWLVPEPYWPENDPIKFIKSVMSDETLIEDWTRDGKWTGSRVLRADDEPDTKDIEPEQVVYIRSWSGARDRTILGK